MKISNTLLKIGAIFAVIIAFASCEEDFNTIGSEVIGDEGLRAVDTSFSVITYSKNLGPVQTNNLNAYQLGVYNDPLYGKTTVNYLSQIFLDTLAPDFGEDPEVDGAFLHIPFFNTPDTDDEGDTTYELDSIFGNSPIRITVFESNYFLRDLDPTTNFTTVQPYYSDQGPLFDQFKGEQIGVFENFTAQDTTIIFQEDDPDTEDIETIELTPGLYIELSQEFIQEKLLNRSGEPELANNNNFKEYFRGLYFTVESVNGDDGTLFLFDPNNVDLRIQYTGGFTKEDNNGQIILDENGEPQIFRQERLQQLSLGGQRVNTVTNNLPSEIEEQLTNANTTEGEETLYLRGNGGSISIIELFGEDLDGDGVPEELADLRDRGWIINEANLKFYVDQDKVTGGETEPERIILFDIPNRTILPDFGLDLTSTGDPLDAGIVHLGRLERGSDENGDFYKTTITNHLTDVILRDSTNVPLGLMVSQNVLLAGFQRTRFEQAPGILSVPASAVLSPEGTALHGNNSNDASKRLKLEVFYTDPNQD